MCMIYNEACTFPSEKQKWPAQIRAAVSRIGKPLRKLTSLSKCMKCSLFQNPSLMYCFASPMKETMPLPWAKLPKDSSWESEPSWTSPVGLVDASSGGCLELRAGSQNGRLAGGGRALTLEFKGGSSGREGACCLRSRLLASEDIPPYTARTGLLPASHVSRKTWEDSELCPAAVEICWIQELLNKTL